MLFYPIHNQPLYMTYVEQVNLDSQLKLVNPSDLESTPFSESENKHLLLTHICRILNNGIDDLICKVEIETQTWRTNAGMLRGGCGMR